MNIDADVPMPDSQNRVYPWRGMEVGHSFYADVSYRVLRSAAHWQEKRYGTKYTIRKEGTGARVWRVA